jgi:hypothetical protein
MNVIYCLRSFCWEDQAWEPPVWTSQLGENLDDNVCPSLHPPPSILNGAAMDGDFVPTRAPMVLTTLDFLQKWV